MRTFVIVGLLVAAAVAVPMPESENKLDCFEREDFLTCMAIKADRMIRRAARSKNLEIINGVSFVQDGAAAVERSGKSLESETEVMEKLSSNVIERTGQLASMLTESASQFANSHSLKIADDVIPRSLEEARTKLKKSQWQPILLALAGKFALLLPILFTTLGFFVLKSIVISKLALLIAGVLGFQKLFGSNGSANNAFSFFSKPQAAGPYFDNGAQNWQAGGPAVQPNQSGYYKRSIDEPKLAQNLAYSAHAPSDAHTIA